MKKRLIFLPLVLGDTPLINLLPPGVKRREYLRMRRRLLALAVLASLFIADGGYFYAYANLRAERTLLADARASSEALASEESTYNSTALVVLQGNELRGVEKLVGGSDILWTPLLSSIDRAVSTGATITSFSVLSDVKWAAPPNPPGPLDPVGIGTGAIVVEFDQIERLQGIVDSLISIVGISTVAPSAVVVAPGGFSTTLTITFGPEALSKRYTETTTGVQ